MNPITTGEGQEFRHLKEEVVWVIMVLFQSGGLIQLLNSNKILTIGKRL